ncbi:MAG: hypothetical protein ACPGR2_00535 [Psychrobium sp.]
MKVKRFIKKHKAILEIALIPAIFCLLIVGFYFTRFDGFELGKEQATVVKVYEISISSPRGGSTQVAMAKVRLNDGVIVNAVCKHFCVTGSKIKVTVYQTLNPFKKIYVHEKEQYPNFETR